MESRKVFGLVVALTITPWSGAVFSIPPIEVVEGFVSDQLLNNVVKIQVGEVHRSNPGLGFIFGRNGNTVWIATAAHVAFPDFGKIPMADLKPASAIKIFRRGDSRPWQPIGDPEVAFGGDIAFIGVDMPLKDMAPDLWREPVVVNEPEKGESLQVAGMPGDIVYGEGVGKFGGYGTQGEILIESLEGSEGQSGAPVATKNGFIGMYTQSAGARVISIKVIEDAASRANRPWQLSVAPKLPAHVSVCLKVIGLNADAVSINGPSGLSKLDTKGCAHVMTGLNTLVPPMYRYCEPSKFLIDQQSEQVNQTICSINPAGVWQSDKDGYLNVTAEGENFWRIQGLNLSPFGWFAGSVTENSSYLVVNARTQFGLIVTGQLVLEERHLSGKILVGGNPYSLELKR